MSKKEFKYKTAFSSTIKITADEDKSKLATASLDNLKAFLPQFNSERDWDLVGFVSNIFAANLINQNSDVIRTKEALATYKNFIYRPADREHQLNDRVGVIVNAGLTRFDEDYKLGRGSEPLTEEEAAKLTSPFNVCAAGFFWSIANEDFIKSLRESNDPESDKYLSISSSMEFGFDEFIIVKSKTRNLADATLIEDQKEIDKYTPYLKSFGGTGKSDGFIIGRLLVGQISPIGFGCTVQPAGSVRGILVSSNLKSKLTCSNCNKEMEYSSEDMDEDEMMECANCKSKIDKSGKVMANTENLSVKNIDNDYKQYFDFRMRLAEINKNL